MMNEEQKDKFDRIVPGYSILESIQVVNEFPDIELTLQVGDYITTGISEELKTELYCFLFTDITAIKIATIGKMRKKKYGNIIDNPKPSLSTLSPLLESIFKNQDINPEWAFFPAYLPGPTRWDLSFPKDLPSVIHHFSFYKDLQEGKFKKEIWIMTISFYSLKIEFNSERIGFDEFLSRFAHHLDEE